MAKIVLSRGHNGTGGRPGAEYGGFREEVGARKYMAALEDTLVQAGHDVYVISGFPYRTRFRRARDLGADVYLACHCNATPETSDLLDPEPKGIFGYDHRSKSGARLAAVIADEVEDVKGRDCKAIRSYPGRDWTSGMFHVISGVWEGRPVGCTLEPLFVDQVEDEIWRTDEGLKDLGQAIGRGVIRYLKEKGLA